MANFTCQINSISTLAEVYIEFSEDAEPFDKSLINETSLDIKVIPSAETSPDELTQEDLSKFALSWQVRQFYKNKLYIQLKFENPL